MQSSSFTIQSCIKSWVLLSQAAHRICNDWSNSILKEHLLVGSLLVFFLYAWKSTSCQPEYSYFKLSIGLLSSPGKQDEKTWVLMHPYEVENCSLMSQCKGTAILKKYDVFRIPQYAPKQCTFATIGYSWTQTVVEGLVWNNGASSLKTITHFKMACVANLAFPIGPR